MEEIRENPLERNGRYEWVITRRVVVREGRADEQDELVKRR